MGKEEASFVVHHVYVTINVTADELYFSIADGDCPKRKEFMAFVVGWRPYKSNT